MKATREANGKIILLGEHSVVYGQPAIAAPIDRRLRLTATLGGSASGPRDERLQAALVTATRRFGLEPQPIGLTIDSEIPPGAGLGSSAALSVALVEALSVVAGVRVVAAHVTEWATEVEQVFHGTASGLDVAVVSRRELLWFRRGAEAGPIAVGGDVDLVVGLSGEPRESGRPVASLRRRVERDPKLWRDVFRLSGALVERGARALETADWERLGATFDAAHGLLNACGVSTPRLEHMVARAREAGALGAKLTGAGGGGAMIALTPGCAGEVCSALAADGFDAFVTTLRGRERGC